MPVIVGALGMIQKGIYTVTKNMRFPNYMEYKKVHFAELLISLGEYNQCGWKISSQKRKQKYEYIEYI